MGYRFFENKECEYYPCHKAEQINCLFCFCPLYGFDDCGGNFKIIHSSDGDKCKDCSDCVLPHIPDIGYEHVINRLTKEKRKNI